MIWMLIMEYLPTMLKIIENGALANTEKVASYTKVLADKLRDDGDTKAAQKVLNIIKQTNTRKGISPASALNASTIPVDRDSRFSLADESFPDIKDIDIQLDKIIEGPVEEFISFVENAHLLSDAGVGISPSMLIYGPPGCGKSYLAQHIAARLKLPLLTTRCDSLMSSLLGSTAKNIRNLFDHAANRPCVLFLDEFDALAKARDDQHEVGELKRVVVGLLQNIDNLPSDTVVLAATNHENLLDPAVWRRFAYRLNIQMPSYESREKLLKQYLKGFSPKNLKNLTSATEGMSGALIQQACEALIRLAVLNGDSDLDENKLLVKIAQIQHYKIIQSHETAESKIRQLKQTDSRLFTTRVLSELFTISTGKISKILNSPLQV